MRTRLVLFDVDGTLIDAYGAGRRALEQAFSDVFGLTDPAAHLDAIWFAGKTDLYIFRQLAANAGIESGAYETRYGELESVYLDRLRSSIARHDGKRILPGVAELLDTLSRHEEIALGLMTGNLEAGARIKIAPWDLNRYFPAGGFGGDAADRSAIGRVARERFEERLGTRIDPESILVVGDTPHDIAAAHACGFRVLAVGTGWTEEETLRGAGPDHFAADLSNTELVLRAIGF